MTNFRRKMLILNAKTPKFTSARVAQIVNIMRRKMLILNPKTTKSTSAQVAQIMINF